MAEKIREDLSWGDAVHKTIELYGEVVGRK